jgi:hypothetical protein
MEKHKYLSNFDYFSYQSNAFFSSLDCDYTQRPPMSFAIANNLLAPNTRPTTLGISPWATIALA